MSAHFYDFKNYLPNNYKTNLMLPYPPNLRKPLTNKCNLKEKIETTKHQKQKKTRTPIFIKNTVPLQMNITLK